MDVHSGGVIQAGKRRAPLVTDCQLTMLKQRDSRGPQVTPEATVSYVAIVGATCAVGRFATCLQIY